MNCLDCETLILDDAELDPTAIAVRTHLNDCGKCRDFFTTQLRLHRLLSQGLRTVRLSAEFQSRLSGQIQRDQSLHRLRRAISFTEFASVPLLVVTVFFVSASLMRLPLLDPGLYVPAIAAGIVLTIVKDVVSDENASG